MKILRVIFNGIPIFQDEFKIELTAKDRVSSEEAVTNIWNTTYAQSVIALIGINAVGKTTALKLLNFALQIVINNRGLNDKKLVSPLILDKSIHDDGIKMTVDFFNNDKFYQLESVIKSRYSELEGFVNYYESEILREKYKSTVTSKKNIFDFTDANIIYRDGLGENQLKILKEDDSIAILASGKESKTVDSVFNTLEERVEPILFPVKEEIDRRILKVLDPNLVALGNDGEKTYIEFENDMSRIESDSSLIMEEVLSLGTIKGQKIIRKAIIALKSGGYLLIDEIENSLNKEIVNVIINIFNNKDINKNGACLIFTTHYPEILDMFDRKDNIYVFKRNENKFTMVDRYSEFVKRNELKKSDVILSNYIKGTAPSAISIDKLEEYICQQV